MKCENCTHSSYCSGKYRVAGFSVCLSCKNNGKDLETCKQCCSELNSTIGYCHFEPMVDETEEPTQVITSKQLAQCLEEIYYTEYDGSDNIEDFISWLKSEDFVRISTGGEE